MTNLGFTLARLKIRMGSETELSALLITTSVSGWIERASTVQAVYGKGDAWSSRNHESDLKSPILAGELFNSADSTSWKLRRSGTVLQVWTYGVSDNGEDTEVAWRAESFLSSVPDPAGRKLKYRRFLRMSTDVGFEQQLDPPIAVWSPFVNCFWGWE